MLAGVLAGQPRVAQKRKSTHGAPLPSYNELEVKTSINIATLASKNRLFTQHNTPLVIHPLSLLMESQSNPRVRDR